MLVHKGGKIENWSGECRDIMPTKLQCQTIQRALHSPNLQREIIREKNNFFFKFSPIDLLIILYQLTKFEATNCYYTPGIYAEGYIVFVFPFVRSSVCMFVRSFVRTSVTFVEFASKFYYSFSSGVYLSNYIPESIHIWTIVTLEGWH